VGVNIERTANAYRIFIKAARPGLIIGRGGKGIEDLNKEIIKAIVKLRRKNKISEPVPNVSLNVSELPRGDVSAEVVAQNIASDLERRFKFRRTIKKYLDETMAMRALKVSRSKSVAAWTARKSRASHGLPAGSLPLTTLGRCRLRGSHSLYYVRNYGIKVWVYKGEVFNK
jgi:small subunit ribosomal protein S3